MYWYMDETSIKFKFVLFAPGIILEEQPLPASHTKRDGFLGV